MKAESGFNWIEQQQLSLLVQRLGARVSVVRRPCEETNNPPAAAPYDRPERPEKSATVFNLGYTEEVAAEFPWVAELSGGVATGHPRQRDRG